MTMGSSGSLVPGRRRRDDTLRRHLHALGVPAISANQEMGLGRLAEAVVPLPVAPTTQRWFATLGGMRNDTFDESAGTKRVIAIFLHGKWSKIPEQTTPDSRARVRAVFDLFYEGWFEANDEIHLVFMGYGGEANALLREFENQIEHYGLALDKKRLTIHLETSSKNTTENVRNGCTLLMGKGIVPDLIVECSQDWHLVRMYINYDLAKEVAEFSIPGEVFKERRPRLALLFVPYAHREPTQEAWRRWAAEVHVETHFMAPLVTILYAIADGKISELRTEAVTIFCKAHERIKELMGKEAAEDPNNSDVLTAWRSIRDDLDGARNQIEQRAGESADVLLDSTFKIPTTAGSTTAGLRSFTDHLNGLIRMIRVPSDPDRA